VIKETAGFKTNPAVIPVEYIEETKTPSCFFGETQEKIRIICGGWSFHFGCFLVLLDLVCFSFLVMNLSYTNIAFFFTFVKGKSVNGRFGSEYGKKLSKNT
jgi:hypothetical protein